MTILTIEQKAPEVRVKPDGTGFELDAGYEGVRAHLKLGNVSVAFDARNQWRGRDGETFGAVYTELGEYTDDPVRLNGGSVDPGRDTAEKLLFALAADLGYRIEREG
jgi:hypothetical protein